MRENPTENPSENQHSNHIQSGTVEATEPYLVTSERDVAVAYQATPEGTLWRHVAETGEMLWWGENGWDARHDVREQIGRTANDQMMQVRKDGVCKHPARGKNSTVSGACSIFKHLPGVLTTLKQWDDPEAGLVGLPGRNALDLELCEAGEEAPEHLIRKRLGVLPVKKAREGNAWETFLAQAIPSAAERRVLKLALALALIGRPSQHAILLAGPRRTGKSTLSDMLRFLFGSYAANLPADAVWMPSTGAPTAFKVDAAVAGMDGKRIGIVSDAPPGHKGLSNVFRALTGDSEIPARKANTFFDVQRTFLVVMVANELPRNLTGSETRRIILIQMPHECGPGKADVDPELSHKLVYDSPDFLAELLTLIPEVTRPEFNILHHIPESTEDVVDRASREDVLPGALATFMDQATVRVKGSSIPLSTLYEAYCDWRVNAVADHTNVAPRIPLKRIRGKLLEQGYQCGQPTVNGQRLRAVLGVGWR